MKHFYFLFIFSIGVYFSSSAQISCGDSFFDTGGQGGQYADNELETITICSDIPGQVVSVQFLSFITEQGFDFLTIYNGNSATGTPIGVYDGDVLPTNIVSTHASGCLTFVFESDGSITEDGWEAVVNCVDPITCPSVSAISASNVTGESASIAWTNGGSETSWAIEYGPDGFSIGDGITVIVNSNPFTISGLTGSTSYDVYVTAICSAADSSFVNGPLSFSTGIAPFICGNLFVDNGGAQAYTSDSQDTTVICPSGIFETVSVVFSAFDTEEGYDSLMVFNGSSTTSPLIGTYQGLNDSIGTIISTSTDGCLTFVFISDGSVQNAGWTAEIACIDENASVVENEIDMISIYPNPSNGKFILDNKTLQSYEINITDMKGSVVVFSNLNKANQELDLSHLENGIYFVQFTNASVSFTKQINIIK